MTFITVAVVSAFFLAFSSTRKFGVIGTGLLLYFKTYYTIGVLLLVGIAYIYLKRRHTNELRKLLT